jgi:hypothetical protein
MNLNPCSWRQRHPTNEITADATAGIPTDAAPLPLDADLSALLAHDDTLLATIQERCRIRGLYLVHNGREIKVAPHVEPGWRVIVENDLDRARKVAA